jgi:hypothetical protein
MTTLDALETILSQAREEGRRAGIEEGERRMRETIVHYLRFEARGCSRQYRRLMLQHAQWAEDYRGAPADRPTVPDAGE